MKKFLSLFLFVIFVSLLSANVAPELSNITVAQRTDGSKLVDILYDVADEDGDTLNVSLIISSDNGVSWDITPIFLTGDIGSNIIPGVGKQIIWDAGNESATYEGNEYKFKITADDSLLTDEIISDAETLDTDDPVIDVTYPNGSEILYTGNTENITWSATDYGFPIDAVTINFSSDNGSNFEEIASGEPNNGSFSWQIPNELTTEGLINIEVIDNFGNSSEDTSDNHFSIEYIYVPDDYLTIQAAVDASVNGNVIIVREGLYQENVQIIGKEIILASEYFLDSNPNHIDNTIIDGSNPSNPDEASVLAFLPGTKENSVTQIIGFTIQGGSGWFDTSLSKRVGGGFYIKGSKPVFTMNKIVNNAAEDEGGGGYVLNCNPNFGGEVDDPGSWNILYNAGGNVFIDNNAGYGNTLFTSTITDTIFAENCHFDVYSTTYQDIPEFWAYTDGEYSFLNGSGEREAIISDAYVSTTGDDDNLGSTPLLPFLHIYRSYEDIYATENNIVTIHLAPGTYSPSATGEIFPIEPIDYVIIEGLESRDETTIDANNQDSVFKIIGLNTVTFKNLIITKGYSEDGGAIHCDNSSISINNSTITSNYNSIRCTNSNVSIKNSQINGNTGVDMIDFDQSEVEISNCDISSPSSGATLFSSRTNIQIIDSYIEPTNGETQTVWFDGINDKNLTIQNSIFKKVSISYLSINCNIIGSIFDTVYNHNVNNTSYQNIFLNTVFLNHGFTCSFGDFYNCIFFNDSILSNSDSDLTNIYNCCFYGNSGNVSYPPVGFGEIVDVNANEDSCDIYENIFLDPLFVNPSAFNFSLQEISPCINAGTQDTTGLNLPDCDVAGNPRIYGDFIDMGAYEFQGSQLDDQDIVVTPDTLTGFNVTLDLNDSTTRDLIIGNNGDLTISYTADIVYSERLYNLFNNRKKSARENKHAISDKLIKPAIIAPVYKKEYISRACEYTIDMYDDYGDGWNGGYLDLLVNDVIILNDITVSEGSGPVTHSFSIDTDDEISTTFYPGGWAYECSYFIYDNLGVQVASDGDGGVEPTGLSPFIVSCEVDSSIVWLFLDGDDQVNGSIDGSSPDDVITVSFDTTSEFMDHRVYNASIVITSNDPDEPELIIPVTLNVTSEPPNTPENLGTEIISGSITISWDSVPDATSYNIYSSDDPYLSLENWTLEESGIAETTWSEPITEEQKFFYVKALN